MPIDPTSRPSTPRAPTVHKDSEQETCRRWKAISDEAQALCVGCADSIANMANIAAVLWQSLPDINWVGFYRYDGQQLILGPFQGKPACIYIPLSRGVCGVAAHSRTSQCIDDLSQFPDHIACDAHSRSELVVPIIEATTGVTTDGVAEGIADGATDGERLIGVFDIDSPYVGRFSSADQTGAQQMIARIVPYLSPRIAPPLSISSPSQ